MSKSPQQPTTNPSSGAGSERKKSTGGYPEGQPSTKPPQHPDPGSAKPKSPPTRKGN